jgi:hypothetical protein
MCPALTHYRKHLWNSIFAILYSIACHSDLILVILISGDRKNLERLGRAREWWGTTIMHILLKLIEKTMPCNLAPCCNAEHRLFVQFHYSFLPNSTFKEKQETAYSQP